MKETTKTCWYSCMWWGSQNTIPHHIHTVQTNVCIKNVVTKPRESQYCYHILREAV